MRYETDIELRARLMYVAGDSPQERHRIETASGKRLEDLAAEFNLKRCQVPG